MTMRLPLFLVAASAGGALAFYQHFPTRRCIEEPMGLEQPAGGNGVGGELRTGHQERPSATLASHFDFDSFARELGRRESNNNDKAIGDKGKSLGRYQFTQAAWRDINEYRRKQHRRTWAWAMASQRDIATEYLRDWVAIQSARYSRRISSWPTEEELIAIHSYGFVGFIRRREHQVQGQAAR